MGRSKECYPLARWRQPSLCLTPCYFFELHRIIDNSCDFATKVERVINSISEGMGVAIPTQVFDIDALACPAVPRDAQGGRILKGVHKCLLKPVLVIRCMVPGLAVTERLVSRWIRTEVVEMDNLAPLR